MRGKRNGLESDIDDILKGIIPCQICKYSERENYERPCRDCNTHNSYVRFTFKIGSFIEVAKDVEKYIIENYSITDINFSK